MAAILKNKMPLKGGNFFLLLISTISMGQHNNYYAIVYLLSFQSQDPSPPLNIFYDYYVHLGMYRHTPFTLFRLTFQMNN